MRLKIADDFAQNSLDAIVDRFVAMDLLCAVNQRDMHLSIARGSDQS